MIIGLDIGGTKINIILFDPNKGRVIKQKKESTPNNKKDFFEVLFDLVKEMSSDKAKSIKAKSIGVGVAGTLDLKKGKILRSMNMSFLDGVYLKKILEDKFKLPVRLDNDARCFLRGEALFGAAKGCQQAIGITLGTGIGGCLLIEGKIIAGAHHSAGEIGHTIIKYPFTLEDLASQKGIKKIQRRIEVLSDKTTEELLIRAQKGYNDAKEIFEEVGFYLGIGLANLVNILDPEVIIIGGGLSQVGDFILKPAKASMNKFIISPQAKKVKISLSKLGENAGAIGAACLWIESG